MWVCEQCGSLTERDVNAALNIRDEARRLVTDVLVVASSGQKFAGGAESAGSGLLVGNVSTPREYPSETFCDEAGTKVS